MSESNVRPSDDRVSCRKMLECMIWTGTGVMQKPHAGWRRHSPSVTLLVAALAAGILFPSGAVYADMVVNIDNFTFAPQALTVKAGTTVIWRNEDDIPHTVASTKRVFKSKALDTNDSFSFTFTEPGSYEYFCSLHPHMTGKIVVEPATSAAK
jgi:plastocyanin